MRILALLPRDPRLADTGATIRTRHLLAALRQAHDVAVLAFAPPDGPARGRGWFASAHRVASAFGAVPVSVATYRSRAFRERVRVALDSRAYNAVHCDHVHMAQYAGLADGVPVVIDDHNAEHLLLARAATAERRRWRRILLAREAVRMRRYERWSCLQARTVLTVSAQERAALRALGVDVRIDVVPNGVDTTYFAPTARPLQPAVGYCGSMDWWPNQDAVRFFLERIWGIVRRRRPDVDFVIIGRSPPSGIRTWHGRDGVLVTGTVPDVRPHLARLGVLVVPLRVAGGTRIKILEAQAAGVPVVSTRIGAEGLDEIDGRHLLIADHPEAFAERVLTLLADAPLAQALARQARAFVVAHHEWQSSGQRIREVYETLAC